MVRHRLVKRTIRVDQSWDDEEGETDDTTSDAGTRTVPILAVLAEQVTAHGLATARAGGDLVFGREADAPLIPSTVASRALAAWEGANADVRAQAQREAHDVDPGQRGAARPDRLARGTAHCASTLIAADANPKVIQTVTGHATIQMTLAETGDALRPLRPPHARWARGGSRGGGRVFGPGGVILMQRFRGIAPVLLGEA